MSEAQTIKKPTKGKTKRGKSPAKNTTPVAQTTLDATGETVEKMAELAILGAWRFTSESVQDEVESASRDLCETISDIEAIAGTMAGHLPDDRVLNRDRSRGLATQLASNAATLAELCHRVVRIAGRLEGFIQAAESDRSNRMLESHRDGTLGTLYTDVVQGALQYARRESEADHG